MNHRRDDRGKWKQVEHLNLMKNMWCVEAFSSAIPSDGGGMGLVDSAKAEVKAFAKESVPLLRRLLFSGSGLLVYYYLRVGAGGRRRELVCAEEKLIIPC